MKKLLVVFGLLLVATPLSAQWRRAGLYGADVRSLVVDPARPDTVYLGTSDGEVYVSTDGARTWVNPRGSIPFPGYSIDRLVVDRQQRLWAAGWGLWGGGVIAVSNDGGRTWERRDSGLTDFSVRAIAIDPHDANFVIAGGLTGVYRSTDGGATWTQISTQENVESVAIDPRTHDRIYVGTFRQGYRTDDGGRTWKLINSGMVLDTTMFNITFDPDNPDDVWVATCGWVYNSTNRGEMWTRYRDGFDNRRIQDMQVDPCDHNIVFAGSVAGLYRSDDAGKTWYVTSDQDLVINTIALDGQRPNRIILGVEGDGIYVSHDLGKTFHRSCDGLRNLSVTSIAADPAAANHVYAAVASGGVSSGIYESNDAGVTWSKRSKGDLPAVLSLAINDDSQARFVAGTEKGFFYSPDGIEWTQAAPSSVPIRVQKVVRFNRLRFFAATSQGVYTSRDAARSWYRLADADDRTVDLAIGSLGDQKALFALTTVGLLAFDGRRWESIAEAPARGATLAARNVNGEQYLFIAGIAGVRAGRVGTDLRWHEAEAPDAQYAAVFGTTRKEQDVVFLTSREQRRVLVSSGEEREWSAFPLPSRTAEVTSVALDHFDPNRIYLGTTREGLFIYEGRVEPYEPATRTASSAADSATASWK